jgi:ADP-heptose:LPS heptosyltransferase
MKILVLQLARLGDIYMSWPALRALRRAYPLAEIHLMTRPRFAAATVGLSAIQKVIKLPTTEVLEHIAQENMDVPAALQSLTQFLEPLYVEEYDWIVNMTYSPLSSYITHFLSHPKTKVSGYTRHNDGFLNIADDISAYFYAQVGVDRPNRYHLIELFSTLVGQDLTPEDWRGPAPFPLTLKVLPQEYIVVHIGASDRNKALTAEDWIVILSDVRQANPIPFVLVGSPDEEDIGLQITDAFEGRQIFNYVGKTDLQELFPILKKAKALVGCDSAPIHIANFTHTPVINISFSSVNFWETGPRVLESLVVRYQDRDELPHEKVAQAVVRYLEGDVQDLGTIHCVAGTPSYSVFSSPGADFDWYFLKGLYMSEDFPLSEDRNFVEAVKQLREINGLMLDQMQQVEKSKNLANAGPFLERGEEIIETIAKLVPALQILVRWYQTEKIRIAPGPMEPILMRTMEIHEMMRKVLDLYWRDTAPALKQKEAQ